MNSTLFCFCKIKINYLFFDLKNMGVSIIHWGPGYLSDKSLKNNLVPNDFKYFVSFFHWGPGYLIMSIMRKSLGTRLFKKKWHAWFIGDQVIKKKWHEKKMTRIEPCQFAIWLFQFIFWNSILLFKKKKTFCWKRKLNFLIQTFCTILPHENCKLKFFFSFSFSCWLLSLSLSMEN